jgi:exosortase
VKEVLDMSHRQNKPRNGEYERGDRMKQSEDLDKPSFARIFGRSGSTPLAAWHTVGGLVLLVATLWAYWPTLVEMVRQWDRQPDYSHGYLVLPIALFFLWSRRSTFPMDQLRLSLWGAALLLVAGAIRVAAGMYYLLPLDGWTLPLTVAGVVWLLYGRAVLWWSLPAIIFLWFMVPIPYSAERWLSVPLQAIATQLSTAVLVFLGQPAIAEGNVILLGDESLFVEEACSGTRIFVGIFALAFAFVLFSRWSWWQKALVLAAALPVAIIANVMRIVATGLLFKWVSSEAGNRFSHDLAGFVMIPLAAALFWLLLVYLDRLFPEVEDIRRPPSLRPLA